VIAVATASDCIARDPAKGAVESECGLYRYYLARQVNPHRETRCVFVMLNPSTANATDDDPTIRACREFARRWDCGWLQVVNLYGRRATNPADLRVLDEATRCGPDNGTYLRDTLAGGDIVVAAWGAHGGAHGQQVGMWMRCEFPVVYHLGLNKDGSPKHPLYVKRSTPLTAWELSEGAA
jgi:hypothetical protein